MKADLQLSSHENFNVLNRKRKQHLKRDNKTKVPEREKTTRKYIRELELITEWKINLEGQCNFDIFM